MSPSSGVEAATFIVTRRCGTLCRGCPVRLTGAHMSAEVFAKGSAWISALFPAVKRVKFFGGEPLLNFRLVLRGISFFSSSAVPPRIEVGTNGRLLDPEKIRILRGCAGVQVNINGGVSIRRIFLRLPDMLWNLCVSPERPRAAVERLKRIAALHGGREGRVNIMPEYYRVWSARQLRALARAAREMAAIIRSGGLVHEKSKRTGSVPLFNEGVAVDVDGNCYSTNLCLAAIPEKLKHRFLLGNLVSPGGIRTSLPPLEKKDLVEAFGREAVVSSYAADGIMGEYV